MDKVATKKAWEIAGLPTPPYFIQTPSGIEPHGLHEPEIPCVVKAFSSGSSIDVFVCKTRAEAAQAIHTILTKHGRVLVEKFIAGPELTVGLLEQEPLAPIRIVPTREFFDYEAKYKSTDTEHRFDTGLPVEVIEHCRDLARRANAIIGAMDLARVDIMLDDAHQPYLLEINTLPGFTPKSLLPEAAKHSGIDFGPLVDRLARRAYQRGGRRVI